MNPQTTTIFTPWGAAQTSYSVGPGLRWVSTARHGGILADPDRTRDIERCFPTVKPFAGCNAFGSAWEEDCDWCIPVLTFPELFSYQQVYNAIRTARQWHAKRIDWDTYESSIRGKTAYAKSDAYYATICDKWEVGSMASGPGKTWGVMLTHAATQVKKWIMLSGYPEKQHYTSAEIEALTVESEENEVIA